MHTLIQLDQCSEIEVKCERSRKSAVDLNHFESEVTKAYVTQVTMQA